MVLFPIDVAVPLLALCLLTLMLGVLPQQVGEGSGMPTTYWAYMCYNKLVSSFLLPPYWLPSSIFTVFHSALGLWCAVPMQSIPMTMMGSLGLIVRFEVRLSYKRCQAVL